MEALYIVVPCYNEEICLPQTAPILMQKLRDIIAAGAASPESRVLFVDDGSTDGTWDLLRALRAAEPLCAALRLSPNRGHQTALMAGLMTAKGLADITISIDADLQDDIRAIDKMIARHQEGYHIVCGVRNSRETDHFLKRFTARAYYRLMNIFGAKIIFDHADYRLMDRPALEKLAFYHGDDLFLRGLATRLGYPIATVTYDRAARAAGESKYTLGKMLKLAMKGLSCWRCRPQKDPRPPEACIAERLF